MSNFNTPVPLISGDFLTMGLYAGGSIISTFFSFGSLFAHLGNDDNFDDLAKNIYSVNISWFSIDSIFDLLSAVVRMAIGIMGIQYYWTSILNYGSMTSSTGYWVDLTMTILLFLAEMTYLYRTVYAIMDVITYFTTDEVYVRVKYDTFEDLMPGGDFNNFPFY